MNEHVTVVQPRRPVAEHALSTAMHQVFTQLGVGVGITLGNDVLVEANDALLALLGRERDDVLGASLQDLLGTGQAPRDERSFVRGDGRRAWVRLSHSTVLGQDGRDLLHVHAVEDITDLRLAEHALRERALHDAVTGLANRYLFQDRLDHALAARARTGHELSLVFVDLDGFKAVNDTAGHRAGDVVLREVGRRLTASARAADTVARWAGDEFVVLCEGITSGADAVQVTDRVERACAEPFRLGARELRLTASVGVATTGPDVRDARSLLDAADSAMYAHKAARRRSVSGGLP